MKHLSMNDLLQTEHENREIEPLIYKLDIKPSQIKKRQGKPIDFELIYNKKKIALEVTDIRPYIKIHKIAKQSTENTIEKIIKESINNETISYFQINIILTEKTYNTKNLQSNLELKKEIQEFILNGHYDNSIYIKHLSKKEYTNVNINKNDLSFNFQYEGFSKKIPLTCVNEAISRKEKKLSNYKNIKNDHFDEYWLCISLPFEEKGYSIEGINIPNDFKSEYQHIFLTQFKPPKIIDLYSK